MSLTQAINGELNVGDKVIAAPSDEYGCLVGVVIAIDKLGTPEHDTENETDDVHVNFDFDYPPERIAEIEEQFSNLYDEEKYFDELSLDDVIMAPETLIRIPDEAVEKLLESYEAAEAYCNQVLTSSTNNGQET